MEFRILDSWMVCSLESPVSLLLTSFERRQTTPNLSLKETNNFKDCMITYW